jgi:hypothetical protein
MRVRLNACDSTDVPYAIYAMAPRSTRGEGPGERSRRTLSTLRRPSPLVERGRGRGRALRYLRHGTPLHSWRGAGGEVCVLRWPGVRFASYDGRGKRLRRYSFATTLRALNRSMMVCSMGSGSASAGTRPAAADGAASAAAGGAGAAGGGTTGMTWTPTGTP